MDKDDKVVAVGIILTIVIFALAVYLQFKS